MFPWNLRRALSLFVLFVILATLAPASWLRSSIPAWAQADSQAAGVAVNAPAAPVLPNVPAAFTVSVTSDSPETAPKLVGQTVHLTATVSIGASKLTYIWNFGDGTLNDTGRFAEHTYQNAGTYFAFVIVSDGKDSVLNYTTVVILPESDPTPPDSPISLTANCVSPVIARNPTVCSASPGKAVGVNFHWKFGDGTGEAEGASVTYTFQEPTTYIVEVTASTITETKSLTIPVVAKEQPISGADFTMLDRPDMESLVRFQAITAAGTNVHYQWSFGLDKLPSNLKEAPFVFKKLGYHPVTLRVFNSVSEQIISKSVYVNPRSPTNLRVVTSGPPQPAGSDTTFVATFDSDEKVDIIWNFGDGESKIITQTESPVEVTHRYKFNRYYPVSVIIRNRSGDTSTTLVAYSGLAALPQQITIRTAPPMILPERVITLTVANPINDYNYEWRIDGKRIGQGIEITHTLPDGNIRKVVNVIGSNRNPATDVYGDFVISVGTNFYLPEVSNNSVEPFNQPDGNDQKLPTEVPTVQAVLTETATATPVAADPPPPPAVTPTKPAPPPVPSDTPFPTPSATNTPLPPPIPTATETATATATDTQIAADTPTPTDTVIAVEPTATATETPVIGGTIPLGAGR